MWMPLALGALVLATAIGGASAQDAPASPPASPPTTAAPAPQPSKTPPQETNVHGAVPDLTGRWLILFDVAMGNQQRTVPSFVDIGRAGDEVAVTEHFVNLPADMQAEVERGNQAGTFWQPTPEQLREIDRQWSELPDSSRGVTKVVNDLWAPDAYDDTIKKEKDLEGAVWVLRQTYEFAPGGQRPVKHVNVFGAMERDGTGWKGRTVAASLVVAPFPVPITYKGGLRMIRLDAGAAEPEGWLERLLGAFKGCRG